MSVPGGAFSVGRLPRIAFGRGRFEELPSIVAGHGHRALLLHGGRSFAASPRRAALEGALDRAGVTLVGSVAVGPEPGEAEVEAVLAAHRAADVEVVVAIGGGSVLDCGKAVAGLLRSGTRLMDHLEGVGHGRPYPGPAVPTVAVPTTAGTGSEATRNAVITVRGPTGYKRSFRDERLVPADALVDPDLLAGAPPGLIAANGLDAVTQLIESYTSSRASPFTDALACRGLLAAREGLLAWHRDPDGPRAPEARSAMALAALLSGVCLANAGLGAVHGLASPLGAHLPIPHGAACGAVLWQTVEANVIAIEARVPGSPALSRYAELGRLLGDDAALDDPDARRALVTVLRRWVTELGVAGLAAFGFGAEDIDAVVAGSAGSSMATNPVTLTRDELGSILRAAM